MNKERRERLHDVNDILDDAIGDVEDIMSDEEDAYNAMPESLQYSSRGEKMLDAISAMETIKADIENVQTLIDNFKY